MSLMTDDTPIRMSSKGTWTLRIPAIPKSGNILRHLHWASYSKIMQDWWMMVRAADGFLDVTRPTGKRYVLIVRYSRGKLDRDNGYSAVKPVVDVLKPQREESGVWKTGKRKGQPWHRTRLGHGLILEDDDDHLELKVRNGALANWKDKPYTTITISDFPII